MDFKELREKEDKYTDSINTRRKENYRYARDKGFSPRQAMILAGYSKEEIDKTALDRDDGNDV